MQSNDTTVSLKIIDNLEQIFAGVSASQSPKSAASPLEHQLNIIWIHKPGNGLSSTCFGEEMLKLAHKIMQAGQKFSKSTSFSHKFSPQKSIQLFKYIHINNYHKPTSSSDTPITYTYSESSNQPLPNTGFLPEINLIPEKIPAIVVYESLTGRSQTLNSSTFPNFVNIYLEIYSFLLTHNFEQLLEFWETVE